MRKVFFIIVIISIVVFLANESYSKPGGKIEAEFSVVLRYMGLTWPVCDAPKDNCTVKIKGVVGTLTMDPSSGLQYFPITFRTGEYDTNTDGIVDVIKTKSDIGSNITLGEFTLEARYTQGNGDVLVRVVNEPIDNNTGEFKAFLVH